MPSSLESFFEPRGVAIIGASANPGKLSFGILENLLQYGYSGEVYPVNPNADQILGKPCYADIADVPDPVDLAVIILPSQLILDVVAKCGQRGIRNVTVISGGFKEIGPEGRELEKRLIENARENRIRVIGPNCVGTMNLITGLNTTFIKGMPSRGGIGFISQSGAVCGGVVDHVVNEGIGFSHFLSLGNEADVNETDVIEYLAEDPHTKVIAAYIEGIPDGRRFIEIGKKVIGKKPIVVLKAGSSEQGAKAVSSHTGSLAGSQAAYSAAFRQIGAVEVKTTTELLNVSMALEWLKAPKGDRVAIVTNSGGPAALASDSLAEYHLRLAELSPSTKTSLKEKLNPAAQVDNPVDMLGGAEAQEYEHALTYVLNDNGVDMALVVLVPQSLVNPEKVANAIVQVAQTAEKPVLTCLMGRESIQSAKRVLHTACIPMVDYPELTGAMLGALVKRTDQKKRLKRKEITMKIPDADKERAIQLFLENPAKRVWGEHDTRPMLASYGIPLIEGILVHDIQSAKTAAADLGYPVVLKINSADILHKSDAGGIQTGIKDEEVLEKAMLSISENISQNYPKAIMDGFLIEKMAPKGHEVIIGMKRDPAFGPLMMFGMGGIFVELFKDISFRVASITREDAFEMIGETKAYQVLKGWRGEQEADLEAVVDVMMRLSRLAEDFSQIEEIEINPLLVYPKGKGAVALDCRMILCGQQIDFQIAH